MQRTKVRLILLVALVLLLSSSNSIFAAQANVKLTLWHHWNTGLQGTMEQIFDEFEKEYPWITVEQVFSSTTGAADRMGTLLASGAAPEVMMVRSLYAFQFMSAGGFLSLDDLIKRDNIKLNMYNMGDLRSFQLLGKTYALPSMSGSAWTNIMFYNKDMMTNSGLDPDSPPKTWSEWRTAARRMHRVGGDNVITQGGTHIQYLSNVGGWNDASYWSDDWRKATASNSNTVAAAEFLTQLLQDTYGTYGAHNAFFRFGDSFWEGRSGMFFTNNSGFGIAPTKGFAWGAALAPVNEKNPQAKPMGFVSSTWAYGIPASISKDKLEAAWLLVKWLTTNEKGAGVFARVQGRPSPVISFNRHPEYLKNNPYWNVVISALQYEIPAPPVGALGFVDTAGNDILSGQKSPQQALADADQKMQNALDQYRKVIGQ